MDDTKLSISRRQLFGRSLTLGGAAAGLLAAREGFGQILQACGLTPKQQEGPFFPEKAKEDEDTDLTLLGGASEKARGQVVYLRGRVQDENCTPVAKAVVEIWQANWKGRYDHSGDSDADPNRPFDPNFQYWGIAATDSQGRYEFKTIIPGHYPAGGDWIRPPHIHFKITALGFHDLITQMYFDPSAFDFDPSVTQDFIAKLNRLDKILKAEVPAGQQDRVIVRFDPAGPGFDKGSKAGVFDITLKRVQ